MKSFVQSLFKQRISILSCVTLFLLLFLILWQASPYILEIPRRDSGVFAYVGRAIASGGVPYRDTWDHKPPVIYFLNALGLFISQKSYWGVWFVQVLLGFVSLMVSYIVTKKYFGHTAAFLASLSWIIPLSQFLQNGNLTEEYVLYFYLIGWSFLLQYYFTRKKDLLSTSLY